MFDKAVDAFLPALEFVPDSFVTNKMLENFNGVTSSDDAVFVNKDSYFGTFLVIIWALII